MAYRSFKAVKSLLSWLKLHLISGLTIKTSNYTISLDASFLVLIPVSLWVITAVYIPIVETAATGPRTWIIAGIIIILMFISLFLHSAAHIIAEKVTHTKPTKRIFLSPLGDPAHYHKVAATPGKEAITALAGLVMQCLLAGLFFIIWNMQINSFISSAALFPVFFNLGLAAFNLTPAFPFDGGRVLRAAMWKIAGLPGKATRLARYAGWIIAAGFIIWGIVLLSQKARFSPETAAISFTAGVLVIISSFIYKAWKWDGPDQVSRRSKPAAAFRYSLVVLLMFPLLAVTFSLVPLNQGLKAPGITAPVESMIKIPPEYIYTSEGRLLLTTIIPQAPILAGEWIYAQFDRSVIITPPEHVVPLDKTVKTTFQEKNRMLLDSETTAVIVGLRLAGYPVETNNSGVRILSIVSPGPAEAVLLPDDIITGINGGAITSPAELTGQLGMLAAGSVLDMIIERNGEPMTLSVPTIQPEQEDEPARIGISIAPHTTGYNLPIPVEIIPQKISGGPSAGLMFTLGVYDLLTETDLTGGRKIAGTGTIDIDGNVGAIGGIEQKVVAVERAGAEYFLVPAENYEAAAAAAKHVTVIKVTTAQEAINFLTDLSENEISL